MFKRDPETKMWFTKKPVNWDSLADHQKRALRHREFIIVAGIVIAIISAVIMFTR